MRERLDRALVRRGLARSRAQAQALIATGHVWVDGMRADRAAVVVTEQSSIVADQDCYVSRAAHKLLGGLDDLGVEVPGRALDAGASTGGFTQVLLERGCREVIAVDVGSDQLSPLLRSDPRVTVLERTNVRDLTLQHVAGRPVDLVVADVSFISLTLLIAPLSGVTARGGRMLLMVKPQFEVGRDRLGSGGVVRDPDLQRRSVDVVVEAAAALGWCATGVAPSRLPGASGNREFFVLLHRG